MQTHVTLEIIDWLNILNISEILDDCLLVRTGSVLIQEALTPP